jgi:hypothetical protein
MRDLLDKLDAIFEASVFKTKNSQYVPGHKLGISTSKQGAKTLDLLQQEIPNFDGAEVLTISDPDDRPKYEITVSPGSLSYMITRPNGDVIKLLGSKSAIEQTFNDLGKAVDPNVAGSKPKLPNKGDTAEGLLGAALFAKLLKRQGNEIGEITTDDVWNVFDNLNPVTENDYMVTSKDLGGATDTIWFKLKVKNTVKRALEEPSLRNSITNWMLSPVNYVNSPEGTDYAKEFYANGTPDEIGVISDGLSAQKDKKTDVVTAVRDPGTNKIKREIMPVSLKAGADQFAQHSGGKWKAMETMFSLLGVDLSSVAKLASEYEGYQTQGEQIKAASNVYKTATALLNKQFTDDASEARFIQTVARALRFWATSDDDQVYVVSFGSKGKYDVLQFSQASLIPAMKGLRLRARFVPGDNPKVEVYDEISNQMLFSIRTYIQQQEKGAYQRNVIEKGPLLSKVADATGRYRDRPENVPAPKFAPAARAPLAQPARPSQPAQTNDQQRGGLIDVDNEQEPVGKLTGPAAKTVSRPVESRTDVATLGREMRRR